MISLLASKKGLYLLLVLALAGGFWMLKTHYINVGITRCQTQINIAANAEKDRIYKRNIKALEDAVTKAHALQIANDELSQKLQLSENANALEADNTCLSASRLQRINAISAD